MLHTAIMLQLHSCSQECAPGAAAYVRRFLGRAAVWQGVLAGMEPLSSPAERTRLCRLISDFRPRTFTAGMYHLLANFAALAMQEIEAGANGPLPEAEHDSACSFSRQSVCMQSMLPSRSAPDDHPQAFQAF